jgi:ParB family transcriptional regulator, chromosome partitioning protein
MVDRKLGRGLDFFLSGSRGTQPPGTQEQTEDAFQADVKLLVPNPHQPRREMGKPELEELAASIRASGILQPILARRVGEKLQIVAGERRWRAAQLAGLERVPVLVRAISDDEAAVFGLVENLQREDLNAIEKAHAMHKLLDRLKCSQDELGRRVGIDRSSIANLVRLLDLPEQVQAHVSRGTLTMGHARALLGLADPASRIKLAEDAIRRGLSVRQVEELVRELSAPVGDSKPSRDLSARKAARPAWLNELQETLEEVLGTPVAIRYGRKRSKIVIECAGREQFERIFERLKKC